MKKISKLLTIPLCCAAITTSTAAFSYLEAEPYFGFDAQIRNIKWQQGLGDNLFKKTIPQGNFFGGLKLNDFFGVEVGYENSITRRSENAITAGQNIAGANVSIFTTAFGIPPVLAVSKFQIKGWNANLLGYIPICDEYNLDLIGLIGVARLNVFHNVRLVADSGTFGTFINPQLTLRTFKDEKLVLRLGAGGQHLIDDCYGIRVLFNWEKTARFNGMRSLENPTGISRVSPRNSWMYGAGFFFKY